MENSSKTIEIELTDEEYEKLTSLADQLGKDPEFIVKTGMWIYLKRLEKELKDKE